ncbi:MAG: CoA transferase [Pigmentiphaga sp.]|nr:CoA transferase [Pigmentiphaga sp.]
MGPLSGLKVVEFAGLGPGPFCAMVLADLGAEVISIERPLPQPPSARQRAGDVLARGRRSLVLDLKQPAAIDVALRLIDKAHAVIEGFRPGVMEKLGLGPETCLARNPALVYGRMTGWGQQGPLAPAAGHDINYIALSGALSMIGPRGGKPTPPPGLVGDFGGGAMLLAVGILGALWHARGTGEGQVVDAAICDGAALLSSLMYGWRGTGQWSLERGRNMGDGGAYFYDSYVCSDGHCIAIGAIEPKFYAELLQRIGLADDPLFAKQWDKSRWEERRERLAALFATRTREAWCELLEGSDACFAPVLNLDEAPHHPHNRVRGNFAEVDGVVQPAPAPRFSATPAAPCQPVSAPGAHSRELLAEAGFGADAIDSLLAQGAVHEAVA